MPHKCFDRTDELASSLTW